MEKNPLTLDDFDFTRTKVDIKEIKQYDSEDQYITLAIELFKEVAQITVIVTSIYNLDENNNPKKWNRNEAILGGLMVRISKLQRGMLEQLCEDRLEIAMIIFRCLVESIINVIYLLKEKDDKLFNEFIEYSLREEKRLLNLIDLNIKERGHEIFIETRMKKSIDRSFKTSSFTPNQVDESKFKPWGETIYRRAKKIEMGDIYFYLFSLPSHSIHGNWQDLITYHLDYENGIFTPRTQWSRTRPQPIFTITLLSGEINKQYLDEIIPDCYDKKQLNNILEDIIERTRLADDLHEKYLTKAKYSKL